MKLAVNHLPVLTWNSCKLNEAQMEVSDSLLSEDIDTKDALLPVRLPEGISRNKADAGELAGIFEELGVSNPKEKVIAGKFPIYNTQKFGTGMGGDVDELMKGVATDVYTVEGSCHETAPVKLHYEYAKGQSDLTQILIHAKAGSESTFLLYFSMLPKDSDYLKECGRCILSRQQENRERQEDEMGLIGARTYLYLEEGAVVHFHVVQMLEKQTRFFHDIGAFSCRDSRLVMTKLDLGALQVYEGLNEVQMGDRSTFEMDFGYLGLAGSRMDINYNDVFLGKKSEGRMYFKEALLQDAQKTFRGTLDFRQYSTGAKGDEQEDVILLGEDIVNKTIPLILGEEEDVDGRHAATIGSLSEDMLFYMQTRGIDKRKAEELMVRASLQHICNLVPSESIKKAMLNDICRVFE